MDEIKCPHCRAVYEDEGACVSYQGEIYEARCGDCGIDFKVKEIVSRTYETFCDARLE